MKKLIVFNLLFFVVTLSIVNAQNQHGWSSSMPGIQQLIVEHGDELNLTDEQKSELIAISLERRNQFRSFRSRGMRSVDSRSALRESRSGEAERFQKQRRELQLDRPERSETRERGEHRQRTERSSQNSTKSVNIGEVLNDDQMSTLETLLTARAERQHEFRTLRNRTLVDNAGIEGDKASDVLSLLNRISENHKNLAIQRLQVSGDSNFENIREVMSENRQLWNELRNNVTAAEYEKLQLQQRTLERRSIQSGRPMLRMRSR